MQMKRKISVYLIVLLVNQLFSQGFQLEGVIQDLPDGWIYLSSYYKTEYIKLDSTKSVNGSFYFHKTTEQPDGMYKLDFENMGPSNKQKFIEFVWSQESFQLFADYSTISKSVVFENSIENMLLEEFRNYERIYEAKMTAIYPVIDKYPEADLFLEQTRSHFLKLQEDHDAYILELEKSNPGTFAASIIRSYRKSLFGAELIGLERLEYLREHYFDSAPMDNPALIFAPIYTKKIIDFLKLFGNPEYTFGDQEEAFMEAVDIIMANTSGDPEIRSFVVEYLLEGFESFGMEKIQTYIVDTYVDETCTTDAVELAYQRVLGYRKMAEGNVAADIYIRGADNHMVRLSEVPSEYTLVIFWATYCEHCTKLMPSLREWYDAEKPANLEIFAVSIDTSEYAWQSYNKIENPPWINTREPMAWTGKSPEDYNVYATPSMFLLDRQRKIIAKPYTFRELRREAGKLIKDGF